jgi:hypothetical protein
LGMSARLLRVAVAAALVTARRAARVLGVEAAAHFGSVGGHGACRVWCGALAVKTRRPADPAALAADIDQVPDVAAGTVCAAV